MCTACYLCVRCEYLKFKSKHTVHMSFFIASRYDSAANSLLPLCFKRFGSVTVDTDTLILLCYGSTCGLLLYVKCSKLVELSQTYRAQR